MREWTDAQKVEMLTSRCEVLEEILERAEKHLVYGQTHEALKEIRVITDDLRKRKSPSS